MCELKVRTIIGIDPGASGGIAVWQNGKIATDKMPKDITELVSILDFYKQSNPIIFLEKVQVRPDDASIENGKVNMGKIYRIQKMLANFESLKTAISLSGIPFCLVHPMKWQARLCLRVQGEERTERKKRYKEVAQKLYPYAKVTMQTCDAVLLVEFGKAMLSDGKGKRWIVANIPSKNQDKLFQ